jgi:hypothetical protein
MPREQLRDDAVTLDTPLRLSVAAQLAYPDAIVTRTRLLSCEWVDDQRPATSFTVEIAAFPCEAHRYYVQGFIRRSEWLTTSF